MKSKDFRKIELITESLCSLFPVSQLITDRNASLMVKANFMKAVSSVR